MSIRLSPLAEESSARSAAGVDVRVARTRAQVEALRSEWRRLPLRNVDADLDYFLAVLEVSPQALRPHVVWIRRPGRPDLVAIARLEHYGVRLKAGYRTLARPELTAVVVTYGGLVGVLDRADAELLIGELRRSLVTGEAEAVVLRDLDETGETYAVARGAAGSWRVRGDGVRERWLAPPPQSLEAFVAAQTSSARKEMNRCRRRLLGGIAGDVQVRNYRGHDQVEPLLEALETVTATAYQRRIDVGFRRDALTTALTRLGVERGWLRAWVLHLDGRPVAYWTGALYGGVFGSGITAYDPAYGAQSVSRFAMLAMVEGLAELTRNGDLSTLDLGQGHGEYKKVFHPRAVAERDVIAVARRPRALVIALLASGSAAANRRAKRVAETTDWGRALVRRWRHGRARRTGAESVRP